MLNAPQTVLAVRLRAAGEAHAPLSVASKAQHLRSAVGLASMAAMDIQCCTQIDVHLRAARQCFNESLPTAGGPHGELARIAHAAQARIEKRA